MNSIKLKFNCEGSLWQENIGAGGAPFTAIFLMTWGIVLRAYLDTDDVFFEYGLSRCESVYQRDGIDKFVPDRPFNLKFDGSMTVKDTVRHAYSVVCGTPLVQDDLEHDHETHRETDPKRGTLSNTCMLFWDGLKSPIGPDMVEGTILDDIEFETKPVVNYDMVVHVLYGKVCYLSYNATHVSDDQAAHVAATFETVAKCIADAPHRLIQEVEVLSQLDIDRLKTWNACQPIAVETCYQDLFRQRCDLQPDSPAVIAWDGSFTYDELDHFSSVLAIRLQAAGIGPDVFVTVCSTRCRWIPVAMLGIVKARGAFCALDLSHPLDRLKNICDALKSTITITTPTDSEIARELASTVIVIGGDALVESDRATPMYNRPKPTNGHPRSALYSVFTSGSSGKPKGVVIEHSSFVSSALASIQPLDIRPHDRLLHFSSYAFDISVFEVLTPLISGATIAIPSEKSRKESLTRAVQELGATWALFTPTVARLYAPDEFPSLRTLALGGELAQTSDIALWKSKNVVIFYNPAECCPIGVSGPACPADARFLGWSHACQRAWIVDPRDHNKLLPIGAVGELLIEGPVVARCYTHDPNCSSPDLQFIQSTPSWMLRLRSDTSSGTRLYRTGDLARYGPDASLYYMGRKDSQVKIRGQRTEPGEIESNLHSILSKDKFVVAIVVVEIGGSNKIIAFVSKDTGGLEGDSNAVGQLRIEATTEETDMCIIKAESKLHSIMPAYMVPSAFLPVNYIPISRSGKIDRTRLKSFALSLPQKTLLRVKYGLEAGDLPGSNEERRLQRMYSLVLEIPRDKVGMESDFFRLGGDSLQAMKLLALAPKEGLTDISYEDIFRYPKLKDLARKVSQSVTIKKDGFGENSSFIHPFSLVIDGQSLIDMAAKQCDIERDSIEDVYPCTPMQASIMNLSVKGKIMPFLTFGLALHDHVDTKRVKQVWHAAHRANTLLRTRIIVCAETDQLYQVVVGGDIIWDDDECGNFAEPEFGPSASIGGPLVRMKLVEGQLSLAIHRALYDKWSVRQLLNDISGAYNGLPLPSRPSFNCYVSYAAKSLDAASSFWSAELGDIDVDAVKYPEPVSQNFDTNFRAWLGIRVLTCQTESIDVVASEFQLSWAMITYARTNKTDVVFGVSSSGRSNASKDTKGIMGPIATIVPLRVTIDGTQDVGGALEELQDRQEEQAMYTHLGLRRIGQLGRNAAAACQIQTILIVEPDLPDLKGVWFSNDATLPDHSDADASNNRLTIKCVVGPDCTDIFAIFDHQSLPTMEVKEILSQFEHILSQIHGKKASQLSIASIDTANFKDWDTLHKLTEMPSVCRNGLLLSDPTIIPHYQMKMFPAVEEAAAHCAFQDSLQEASIARAAKSQRKEPSCSADLISEINRYDLAIMRAHLSPESTSLSELALTGESHSSGTHTVFVTGANGFIGTQILRHCLEDPRIQRVIALVRGSSANEARIRTEESARRAQWWSDCHSEKLEVWPGDLALPHLGLDETYWRRLVDRTTITAIIHNGASVHWLKRYADLEATNVGATAQLLQLVVKNPRLGIVYVSSGRYKDPNAEAEEPAAADVAATAIPYSQTKFVAESLVRRTAARLPRGQTQVRIMSLGLVIGDPLTGVVNADDYLWRLIAACVQAGEYNSSAGSEWTPISDVTSTALAIVETALNPAGVSATIKPITGGLTWSEIWHLVTDMGYDMKPRPESEWMATVRRDLEREQEKHPLWTLSHLVESRSQLNKDFGAGPAWADAWRGDEATTRNLRTAFRQSLRFLGEVGFLPGQDGQNTDGGINGRAFTRAW
ncbi:NRPS protein [Claviceps sp. LM219 group G6]